MEVFIYFSFIVIIDKSGLTSTTFYHVFCLLFTIHITFLGLLEQIATNGVS